VLGEAKRIDEELHRVRVEVYSGQGARDRITKLVRHDLGVAGMARHSSQAVGYYLSNRHLVDDTVSRSGDVMLPRVTVTSGLEQ